MQEARETENKRQQRKNQTAAADTVCPKQQQLTQRVQLALSSSRQPSTLAGQF